MGGEEGTVGGEGEEVGFVEDALFGGVYGTDCWERAAEGSGEDRTCASCTEDAVEAWVAACVDGGYCEEAAVTEVDDAGDGT